MENQRTLGLKRNNSLMFWAQALLSVKTINVVSVLFYLSRGLTLAQVFYTGIVWTVVNFLADLPSSYLADKWGRKKTIILGVVLSSFYPVAWIFAHGYYQMLIGFVIYAMGFAFITGVDEALLYDSAKELDQEKDSLKYLGKYFSAQRVFKIFTPIIAALIAKDLTNAQFIILLVIDAGTSVIALLFAFFLVEPDHYIDLKESTGRNLADAWNAIKSDQNFAKAALSRQILLSATFVLWRYYPKVFVDVGASIVAVGIMTAAFQAALFVFEQNVKKFFPNKNIETRIGFLNYSLVISTILFVLFWYVFSNKYLLMAIFALILASETARWSMFSQYFNSKTHSYNRATTLSMSGLLKAVLDVPFLFIGAKLVSLNIVYPFIFVAFLGVITVIFFRFKSSDAQRYAISHV